MLLIKLSKNRLYGQDTEKEVSVKRLFRLIRLEKAKKVVAALFVGKSGVQRQ